VLSLNNFTLSAVLKLLIDAKISSVPIVDDEKKPLGFVDVLDMTNFVMSVRTSALLVQHFPSLTLYLVRHRQGEKPERPQEEAFL